MALEGQRRLSLVQDSVISSQKEGNSLLEKAVNSLAAIHEVVEPPGGAAAQGRLERLCDELAGAVTGMAALADREAREGSRRVEQLDTVIRGAADMLRESEGKQRGAAGSSPRKRGAPGTPLGEQLPSKRRGRREILVTERTDEEGNTVK